MNPSSSITIAHLPNEILAPILKDCASPSLFSVCTRWRRLLATEVMPSLYKQIGKIHFPQGDICKQAFILDKIYKLEDRLSEGEKAKAIFKQTFALARSLAPAELEFKWRTEEKRCFTLANYASYLMNINRLLMWKALPGGREYLSQEKIKYLPLEKQGELFGKWIENYGKEITIVNLRGIGLTLLPPEICQLSQLQELNLSQNQLTTLPAEIGQFSQLEALYLSSNQLTTLPAEIGQLSQLKALILSTNQIASLPTKLGQLLQLLWLYLNQNQITALPAEIGQLSQLQELNLSQNQLTTLPAEIGQFSQLLSLCLDCNQFASLPTKIGQLSQLRTLSLNYNQLTSLPVEIGQLSQLRRLYLENNQLTTLPAEMGQLAERLNLKLDGNPLKTIPNELEKRFGS
ncbi:leucine-rich repeat domain-containing protein [Neochlamydia sp. EPS4]|uniref:leucine-rich repeat domain-containing protein n=1 Tax=Neochlamydia sp. EPS4 TaxID=1478175 RepID=UPI00069455BF|nr:leucine-rich repeat domain-containing protein [Neochlamydia sp. EPS4]